MTKVSRYNRAKVNTVNHLWSAWKIEQYKKSNNQLKRETKIEINSNNVKPKKYCRRKSANTTHMPTCVPLHNSHCKYIYVPKNLTSTDNLFYFKSLEVLGLLKGKLRQNTLHVGHLFN